MKSKIILLSFLFAFSLLSFVSATFSCNDFASKWSYCGLMNISGVSCDAFWINASDCNVQANNSVSNVTINMSGYYTKLQVDEILANFTSSFMQNFLGNLTNSSLNISVNHVYTGNFSNNLTGNDSIFYTKEEVKNELFQLKMDLSDKIDKSKGSGFIIPFILMFILILVVLVVMIFLLVKKNKSEDYHYPKGKYPDENFGEFEEEDKAQFEKDKMKTKRKK